MPREIERKALTGDERTIFDLEFDRLLTLQLRERALIDIFAMHKAYVLESAEVAKEKFDSPFAGINAGSGQFGFTFIRPEHVFGKAAAAGAENIVTWDKTITTASLNGATNGWIDWIGTDASKAKIHKELLIVPLCLANYVQSPKAVAVKMHTSDRTYPVWNMEPIAKITDTKIFEIAKPFRVLPEGELYTEVKYEATGKDALAILGIAFAKGTYLLLENPDLST